MSPWAVLLAPVGIRSAHAQSDKPQSDAPQTDAPQTDAVRRQQLLRRFDENGDGKLDRDEWRKAQRARFGDNNRPPAPVLERFDANKNGRLDPDELAKARAARDRFMRNRPGNPRPGNATNRNSTDRGNAARNNTDRNESGQAVAAIQQRILARFDADKNGRLDETESQRARAMAQQLGRLLSRPQQARSQRAAPMVLEAFDKDGDERLNEEEIAAMRRAFLTAIEQASRTRPATNRPTPSRIPEALVRRFDENRNGKLDPNELMKLRAAGQRRRGAGNSFALGTLDESGDPAPALLDTKSALARFDSDGDGILSPQERRRALSAKKSEDKSVEDSGEKKAVNNE